MARCVNKMLMSINIIENGEHQNNITSLQDEVSDVTRQQSVQDWESSGKEGTRFKQA